MQKKLYLPKIVLLMFMACFYLSGISAMKNGPACPQGGDEAVVYTDNGRDDDTQNTDNPKTDKTVNEKDVAGYLNKHPNFLKKFNEDHGISGFYGGPYVRRHDEKYRYKTGEAIINETFMDIMFGPNGAVIKHLPGLKDPKRPELGCREANYLKAGAEIAKYSFFKGATTGIMGATDAVVKGAAQDLLATAVSGVKNAANWMWHKIAHGNSRPVTISDIVRWNGAVENIFKHLIKAAERAKKNARLEPDLTRYHLPGFGEDKKTDVTPNGDAVKPREPEIDPLWKESSGLYLTAIENIVKEIYLRKSYYKKGTDEIVRCLDSVMIALGGQTTREKKLVEKKVMKKDGSFELKLVETYVYTLPGGVYRCINDAPQLSDLSSVKNVAFLKAIKNHLRGLFDELTTWVQMRSGSEKQKKMSAALSGLRE
jgi:hypothetical protein